MIHLILKCFAQASGLKVNANKSSALPIRCGSINLDTILAPLGIPCKSFPVTYLGMPLSLRNLTKADLDPFLVKFGNKTAAWKGGLMAKSGRLVLLKSGLTYGSRNLHDDYPQAPCLGTEKNCAALSSMAMDRRGHMQWWQMQGRMELDLSSERTWRPRRAGPE